MAERIFIAYGERVDGYRHAWRETKHGRTTVRYSRTANHPPRLRLPRVLA